jgi:hypothetical protein
VDTRRDAATTDSLGEAIRAVLPALERFLELTLADADALVDEVLATGRAVTART